jgi:hypothetical protein
MENKYCANRNRVAAQAVCTLLVLLQSLFLANEAICESRPQEQVTVNKVPSPRVDLKLEEIPFKIVYETYRATNGKESWELYSINADGSNPINLTHTPDVDELYPHASPDGSRICFVADEGVQEKRVRNVYYMNVDGTGRVKVADNAREPCWSPDGKAIAYLKG